MENDGTQNALTTEYGSIGAQKNCWLYSRVDSDVIIILNLAV